MQPRDTNISNAKRPKAVGRKGGRTFIGNRKVGSSGRDDRDAFTTFGRWAPHHCVKSRVRWIPAPSFDHMTIVSSSERGGNLLSRGPRQNHRR